MADLGKARAALARSIDWPAGVGMGLWYSWTWCLFFGQPIGVRTQLGALAASQLYMAIAFGIVACVLAVVTATGGYFKLYKALSRDGYAVIAAEEVLIVAGTLLLLLCNSGRDGLEALPLLGALVAGMGFSMLTVRWIRVYSRIGKTSLLNTSAFSMVVGVACFCVFSFMIPIVGVVFSCIQPVVSSLLARHCLMKVAPKHSPVNEVQDPPTGKLTYAKGRWILCLVYFMCAFNIGVARMAGNDFVSAFGLYVALLFVGILAASGFVLIHYLRVRNDVGYMSMLRLASMVICLAMIVLSLQETNLVAVSIALCVTGWSMFEMTFFSVCSNMTNPLRLWGFEKTCFSVRAAVLFGISGGALVSAVTCLVFGSGIAVLRYAALGIAVIMIVATFAIPKIGELDKGYKEEFVQMEHRRKERARIEEERVLERAQAASAGRQAPQSACEAMALERGMTKREAEVLGYLLRGRNAAFIESALLLSKSTVKTHIRHIYEKCSVHSQQELLDLAERYNKTH